MARSYRLGRRADEQDRTRRRIVEAAVQLHGTRGLAATTVTDIAARAGVGRQTLYRHFPDEPALLEACSGLYWQRHPWPDPDRWRAHADPAARVRAALRESYAYHRRTEGMLAPLLGGGTGSAVMQPYHDHWRRAAAVVVSPWRPRGRAGARLRAAAGHAISFQAWHSLVRGQGLTDRQAVELMQAFVCEVAAAGQAVRTGSR